VNAELTEEHQVMDQSDQIAETDRPEAGDHADRQRQQ